MVPRLTSEEDLNNRIIPLKREIIKLIEELWVRLGRHWHEEDWARAWEILEDSNHPRHECLKRILRRLHDRFKPDMLPALAATMYFDAKEWQKKYTWETGLYSIWCVLTACLIETPPPDIHKRLEVRLREILYVPHELYPVAGTLSAREPRGLKVHPVLHECLGLLAALPPTDDLLNLTEAVLLGKLNYRAESSHGVRTSYEHHDSSLGHFYVRLAEHLHKKGRFEYIAFKKSILQMPGIIREVSNRDPFYRSYMYRRLVSDEFKEIIHDYCGQLAFEIADSQFEESLDMLKEFRDLQGSRFLLKAAELHESLKLGKLVWADYRTREGPDATIVHLAQATDTEPRAKDEYEEVLIHLKGVKPKTLEYLLPVSPYSRHILCEALGWDDLIPLVEEIVRVSRLDTYKYSFEGESRSSADASFGVVDLALVRRVLDHSDEKTIRKLLRLFRQARVRMNNAVKLVETIAGWTQSWLEKSLPKRNQLAVRAYGLAPLTRGKEEIRERYLFYKQFLRESRQFGMKRQGSERGAALAGLENLARNAGYPDTTRLEWAMEVHITEEKAPLGRTWSIGEYEVELAIEGAKPVFNIRKGDKLLKSVPADVRKNNLYQEMKTAKSLLRKQASRFRRTFEGLMAVGDALTREEVKTLSKLPIARYFLSKLIMMTDDGRFGILDPDSFDLVSRNAKRIPLTEQNLIAHPYHLFRAGKLADWQHEIVRRRIVQPFKQVFRELYLVTPAEKETRTFSNRFAGHVLESRVVGSILHARGWLMEGEYPIPKKPFISRGIEALFLFPETGHILAEEPIITADKIYFLPRLHTAIRGEGHDKGQIPLTEVDPLIFSEVMRDADLVVSVGQSDGATRLSEEAYERRAELVTALLDDLGLPKGTIDGHFVHVKGKLSEYRVHLGTAIIHIEPGGYLCIVPKRWGKRHPKLFLPFAHEEDPKVSEVISKVLLLTNDDKITDKSILDQIRSHT